MQQDFAHADIKFNVTYTEGTATDTADYTKHQITSGSVAGAVNAFVTRGSVGPAPEVTRPSTGTIWISTGSNMGDQNAGNLTHGMIHALGIAGGVNGYTAPGNTSDNRWYLFASEIGNTIMGNSAESAAQALQDHLRTLSSGGYGGGYNNITTTMRAQIGAGPSGPQIPNFDREINYLREGAKRYLKK